MTVGRAGEKLAALGELADAGVVGFSDDGAPVRSAPILRAALAYAGALGLPIVDHPEDASLTEGAEANDGFVATVLGLRGWPVAAEAAAVARDLAVLADVAARRAGRPAAPDPRVDGARRSTSSGAAKAAGLPVTCDVTPHHLALTDEWIAGARRWAWEADAATRGRDGALVAAPYATSLRVNPPLRSRRRTRRPVSRRSCDGTADAIATDHAPHTEVDKAVEFGLAANGISGIETALGRPARGGRRRAAAARSRDRGADDRSRPASSADRSRRAGSVGLVEGAPADLVVFDRSERWTVTADALASRGKNTPLLGMDLAGRVLVTFAAGRIAYEAPDA